MPEIEDLMAERAALLTRLTQIDEALTSAGCPPTLTTTEVAQLLEIAPRSVRTVTARMGVASVGRDEGGNLYDRAAILAAAATRPGPGARTDLQK